jgi:hypothetical protein
VLNPAPMELIQKTVFYTAYHVQGPATSVPVTRTVVDVLTRFIYRALSV